MIRVDLKLDLGGTRNRFVRRRGVGLMDLIQDPWVITVFVLAIGVLVFALYLDHRVTSDYQQSRERVQQAVRDSSSLRADIVRAEELSAKRKAIEERINTIQEIDQNRFAFPHVMDQVAASVPPEVWIKTIKTVGEAGGGNVSFSLTGMAPTAEAAGDFTRQLEMSPFIAGASLESTTSETTGAQELIAFVITGRSELPDRSFLQTVSLGEQTEQTSGGTGVIDTLEGGVESPKDSAEGGEQSSRSSLFEPLQPDTTGGGE